MQVPTPEASTKPGRVYMDVDISDFGPITQGNIRLEPLTVFVGPNGSGKSHAARLLYSILKAQHDMWKVFAECAFDHTKKMARFLTGEDAPGENILRTLPIDETRVDDALYNAIKSVFSSEFADAVRFGSKEFSLDIISNVVKTKLRFDGNMSASTLRPHLIVSLDESSVAIGIDTQIPMFSAYPSVLLGMLKNKTVFSDTIAGCYSSYIPQAMYLPATRSGILHMHKIISGAIIRNADAIPGDIMDFVSGIAEIPRPGGDYADVAAGIERDILGGHINVTTADSSTRITFERDGHEIPLYGTASSVSQVAPLVLYLRYMARRGGVLVMEEPESNLHPANQRTIAKYLAHLSNSGLYVVLTTHSPYIMEQFNNLLQAHDLPKGREPAQCRIDARRAGFYAFGADSGKVARMEASVRDGIPQEEFAKVEESLYGEYVSIQNAHA